MTKWELYIWYWVIAPVFFTIIWAYRRNKINEQRAKDDEHQTQHEEPKYD